MQAEYGQFNSPVSDTRLTVSQAAAFPIVYRRQRELFKAQTTGGVINEKIITLHVKKQVVRLYYEMLTMLQKKRLLEKADSMYAAFLQRTEQRFNAGEGNIVEKTSALTQKLQAANQLQVINADITIIQYQFSNLLNSGQQLFPADIDPKVALISLPDTSMARQYPQAQLKLQQQNLLLQNILLANAKKLPLINLGYSNQSLSGLQTINGVGQTIDGSKRFSSVIAGLNLPIFSGYINAHIKSERFRYEAGMVEYADTVAQQKSVIKQLLVSFQKNNESLKYFETLALSQSTILLNNANLQFNSGAINFLEWSMLVNQSISLQAGYIDALAEWNNTVIELNAYSPNF